MALDSLVIRRKGQRRDEALSRCLRRDALLVLLLMKGSYRFAASLGVAAFNSRHYTRLSGPAQTEF
jgi:hypothetical protein